MNKRINIQHDYRWIRIIQNAMKGDLESVKAYSRKLAEKYKNLGDTGFANCILNAIGDLDNDKS